MDGIPQNFSSTSKSTIIEKVKKLSALKILKNQLNLQLHIAILKHFAHYKIFGKIIFFSSQIYLHFLKKVLIFSILPMELNQTS